MLIADVAVPVPLGHPFSYSVPAELVNSVKPGTRVLCRFGPRAALGVVLEVSERAIDFDPKKLRPISAVIDEEPVLPLELLAFLRELSDYYFAPIGEVLRMALPALERTQMSALRKRDDGADLSARTVAQRTMTMVRKRSGVDDGAKVGRLGLAIMASLPEAGEVSMQSLEQQNRGSRAAVQRLLEKGLVEISVREVPAGPFFGKAVARDVAPLLNAAQAAAVAATASAVQKGERRSFLLQGVTGSGKTEVYLHAIETCLAAGKGALVLVPEIALTPQLVARFRARFGDEVAVIHSGLKGKERHLMWRRLRSGELQVAIGARSALFAPVQRLGLIVVDEEHDSSFKQEEGVRYHARDMAILRAYRGGAVALLGSATPSLESFALARSGKLELLPLPERAHSAAVLPRVELVDLTRIGPGPTGNRLISLPLHRAIEKTLAASEQAILFLNRRGFAPSVLCEACGTILRCESCSVALTFHRAERGRMLCHYCDFNCALPAACASCKTGRLMLEGLGTEKLEAALAEAFPAARVARLDRDVAKGAEAERILERMRRREIDLLVGTQMVTKGHDLPGVTLVGVINADAALSMPDYRAGERSFQLLVQVAGRAGRSDRPGLVLVQTRNPEHPAITLGARHDVNGFVERELVARRELGYPPFGRMVLLRFEDEDEDRVSRTAEELAAAARQSAAVRSGRVMVLGPKPAQLARLRGRFRYEVLLRASERRPLRSCVLALLPLRERLGARVKIVIDVDPVQMM